MAKLVNAEAQSFAADLEDGRLVVCPPFRLEAGYSARNETEYRKLMALLDSFPGAELSDEAISRSLQAQSQLVRTGHHRVPPADLSIAAIADLSGISIVHYDADFDLILEHTDLDYESRWLAEQGTL